MIPHYTPLITSTNTTVQKNRAEILHFSGFDLTMLKSSLQKKGYSVADLPPWTDLWTDKICLCIMFNLNGIKPRKDVTEILISYYYPFFRDITFIFDGANSKRPDFLPEFVDFISCDSHLGWYQQKCIRSCMHRGTEDTKGYLYIADDMFINLTKMADLPSTKIWFTTMETKSYSWIMDPGPKGWGWMWWGPPYDNSKKLQSLLKVLPSKWLNELRKTAGFPDKFKIVATSDIIYIPDTFKSKMATVIDFITGHSDLFCEIATCLAVDIAAPNELIILNYGYLWGDRSIATIKKTAKTAHFVHPVKVGVEQQRRLWIQYMEDQLFSIASH